MKSVVTNLMVSTQMLLRKMLSSSLVLTVSFSTCLKSPSLLPCKVECLQLRRRRHLPRRVRREKYPVGRRLGLSHPLRVVLFHWVQNKYWNIFNSSKRLLEVTLLISKWHMSEHQEERESLSVRDLLPKETLLLLLILLLPAVLAVHRNIVLLVKYPLKEEKKMKKTKKKKKNLMKEI